MLLATSPASFTIALIVVWAIAVPALVGALIHYAVAQVLGERLENQEYEESLRARAAQSRH